MLATAIGASADNNPVDEKWWPSEFGAADEVGAANYIAPQKRLDAVKPVKRGVTNVENLDLDQLSEDTSLRVPVHLGSAQAGPDIS